MTLSPHWRVETDALQADVRLAGFPAVRELVTALMDLADELDHHPDVSFGYNRVGVRWTTHDAGGLSDKDWLAAERTDEVFRRLGAEA